MKVELKQAEAKFQPIKIELTIESLEELKALRLRTVPSMVSIEKCIRELEYETEIFDQSAETQLKFLLINLKNVTI